MDQMLDKDLSSLDFYNDAFLKKARFTSRNIKFWSLNDLTFNRIMTSFNWSIAILDCIAEVCIECSNKSNINDLRPHT
jgi:hypothetical protein